MIKVRKAVNVDDEPLIKLTQECPMDGDISIRIDRFPSYWELIKLRGGGTVLVAETESRIVGTISMTVKNVHILSRSAKALYLADLKVHPQYRKTTVAYRLLEAAYKSEEYQQSDLIFLVTAGGNKHVENMLQGRAIFPAIQKLSNFNVYEIKSRTSFPADSQVNCIKYFPVVGISNSYQRNFKYFNSISLDTSQINTGIRQTLKVEDDNGVLAFAHLIDTKSCKQNVIIDMPLKLKIGIGFMRHLGKILKLSRLPWMNESLDMLYVESFDYQDSKKGKRAFLDLLRYAAAMVFELRYHFLSIAVDARDPANQEIRKLPHYLFKSNLFVHFKEERDRIQAQGIDNTKVNYAIV